MSSYLGMWVFDHKVHKDIGVVDNARGHVTYLNSWPALHSSDVIADFAYLILNQQKLYGRPLCLRPQVFLCSYSRSNPGGWRNITCG